jgi:hypothetical protein
MLTDAVVSKTATPSSVLLALDRRYYLAVPAMDSMMRRVSAERRKGSRSELRMPLLKLAMSITVWRLRDGFKNGQFLTAGNMDAAAKSWLADLVRKADDEIDRILRGDAEALALAGHNGEMVYTLNSSEEERNKKDCTGINVVLSRLQVELVDGIDWLK